MDESGFGRLPGEQYLFDCIVLGVKFNVGEDYGLGLFLLLNLFVWEWPLSAPTIDCGNDGHQISLFPVNPGGGA